MGVYEILKFVLVTSFYPSIRENLYLYNKYIHFQISLFHSVARINLNLSFMYFFLYCLDIELCMHALIFICYNHN
jgi:hypothetical protein